MYPKFLDEIRRQNGLMMISEIEELVARGNIIFDPFSVLISSSVEIGSGNTIFPCVSLICRNDGILTIGDDNTFFSNTQIEALTGPIQIGSHNLIGEGGFTAKTNRPDAEILIGDYGRYQNGVSVFGNTILGSGSQLLGALTADSCRLESGQSFREPDPDLRAGLLKGHGIARGLSVPVGHVIVGDGRFSSDNLELQTVYHPKA
ncbi:AraC family transcriptional regulator [Microvirga sp. W0021]|uniref:AraC family transcriptional regulator n=1 Tax=Hohaiivirga grylli TaxID=3133970 RepID=A0ABV0BG73_9HYPH